MQLFGILSVFKVLEPNKRELGYAAECPCTLRFEVLQHKWIFKEADPLKVDVKECQQYCIFTQRKDFSVLRALDYS